MGEHFPNLFLIGAMRSGTTALHEVLGRHPDIFMSDVKEPAFFADPGQLARDSRVASRAGFAGDRSRYVALFARAGGEPYRGESSTHYAKLPRISGVAERIAAQAPDARILYFVREPVERAVSHYRFAVRSKEERRSLLDAVRDDPFYCAVSDYATQLAPYVDAFGLNRIWVGTLEAMTNDPDAEMGRLHEWLEVAPAGGEASRFPNLNGIAGGVAVARGPNLLHRIGRQPVYQRAARLLAPEVVRDRIRTTLTRPMRGDELRDPAAHEYLHEALAPRVAAFGDLLGRTFPEWTRFAP